MDPEFNNMDRRTNESVLEIIIVSALSLKINDIHKLY